MYKIALLFCLISSSALADVLNCETLLKRVDAKLQAKGIPSYTLEFETIESSNNASAASGVPPRKTRKGKEVGTCNAGTKRLIYTKEE